MAQTPTVNVSGRLFLADGTAPQNYEVRFTLSNIDQDVVGNAILVQSDIRVTSDENGEISVDLWPNDAGLSGTHYVPTAIIDHRPIKLRPFILASGPDVRLVDIMSVELADVPAVDFAAAQSASAANASAGIATEKAGEASASAIAASNFADAASGSAGAAGNHANSASGASDKANQWATAAEDTEVEPGLYSAKHYAAKAAAVIAPAALAAALVGQTIAGDFSVTGAMATGALTVTGDVTVSGLVDGRNVAADGSKLDAIASGAQVNTVTGVVGLGGAISAGQIASALGGETIGGDLNVSANLGVGTTSVGTINSKFGSGYGGLAVEGSKVGISVSDSDAANQYGGIFQAAANTFLWSYAGDIPVFTSNVETARFVSGGLVIGGTSKTASSKLEVVGGNIRLSSNYNLEWGGSNTLMYAHNSQGYNFLTQGATRLKIEDGGNIGIGTTNPSEKLQVKDGEGVITNRNTDAFLHIYSDGTNGTLGTDRFAGIVFGGRNDTALDYDASQMRSGIASMGVSGGLAFAGANLDLSTGANFAANIDMTLSAAGDLTLLGASPKIYIGSDSDQFIYANAASNYMAFYSANSETFRIDSNQKTIFGGTSGHAVVSIIGPAGRPASLAEFDSSSNLQIQSDGSNTDSLYFAEAASGIMLQVTDGTTNSTTAKPLSLNPFGGGAVFGATSLNASSGMTIEAYAGGTKTVIGHNGSAANGDNYISFQRNGVEVGAIKQYSATGTSYYTNADSGFLSLGAVAAMVQIAGSEITRFTTQGQIIGTTSFVGSEKLRVNGAAYFDAGVTFGGNLASASDITLDSGTGAYVFKSPDDTTGFQIVLQDDNDVFLQVGTTTALSFVSGSINATFAGDLDVQGDVVMMVNLPTSDPMNTGQLWNDSGTARFSA